MCSSFLFFFFFLKKVVMFIDLAGHEKYLKTTVFGLTGNFPDYCMMIVG